MVSHGFSWKNPGKIWIFIPQWLQLMAIAVHVGCHDSDESDQSGSVEPVEMGVSCCFCGGVPTGSCQAWSLLMKLGV